VVTHSPQLFYASLYKFLQLSKLEVVRINHLMQFHRSATNASLPHGSEKNRRPNTNHLGWRGIAPQTNENNALVYDVQKALVRKSKCPIQVHDWATTIVFCLPSAIGRPRGQWN
jgi:hypothetical protein